MEVFHLVLLVLMTVICNVLTDQSVNREHIPNEKRLLLHSDLDIAAELAKLNNNNDELASLPDEQQAQISNLKNDHSHEMSALQNELQDLKNNYSIVIQNLTYSLAEKDKEINALKTSVDHLTQRKVSGSTHTRWGRTSCPGNNTELVYKGYMGGTQHRTSGGGVNFLCLTDVPQWDHYDENIQALSKISGVEYEFWPFHNQDGASQFFGKNIYNDDAPCAVCHSARGSSVMIPGRTECYGGWTKEYSGYIVGASDVHPHQTEWICLDRRPDTVVGGNSDDNEAFLYFVEASCGGSLECPPYVQGREITCVVCTK